jgi:hypothetical protein
MEEVDEECDFCHAMRICGWRESLRSLADYFERYAEIKCGCLKLTYRKYYDGFYIRVRCTMRDVIFEYCEQVCEYVVYYFADETIFSSCAPLVRDDRIPIAVSIGCRKSKARVEWLAERRTIRTRRRADHKHAFQCACDVTDYPQFVKDLNEIFEIINNHKEVRALVNWYFRRMIGNDLADYLIVLLHETFVREIQSRFQ